MEGDVRQLTSRRRAFRSSFDALGILAVAGEVDASNVELFAGALAEALENAPGDVTLDLAGLEFLDGTGVRQLLTLAEEVSARGDLLVLRRPGYIVHRALSLLATEDLMKRIRLVGT